MLVFAIPDSSVRKSATVREMRGVTNTFDKKGDLCRGSRPLIIVISDHAANHGVRIA